MQTIIRPKWRILHKEILWIPRNLTLKIEHGNNKLIQVLYYIYNTSEMFGNILKRTTAESEPKNNEKTCLWWYAEYMKIMLEKNRIEL